MTRKTKQGREEAAQKALAPPFLSHKPPTLLSTHSPLSIHSHGCRTTGSHGCALLCRWRWRERSLLSLCCYVSPLLPTIPPASQVLTHDHTHTLYTHTQENNQDRARAAATAAAFPSVFSLPTAHLHHRSTASSKQQSLYFQASNPPTEPWRITGMTMTRYVHLRAEGVWDALLVLFFECTTSDIILPSLPRPPSFPIILFPHRSSSISFPPPSCT